MSNKILTRIFGIACLVVMITLMIAGCTKTKVTLAPVDSSSTLAALIDHSTNLTVLDSILHRTGLITPLNNKDTAYTVFAPPDIAFAGIGVYDSILYRYPVDQLSRLARYHLIAGYAKTATLISNELMGPNSPYLSASGDTLYFTVSQNGIFVNGNPLTQTDVMGTNGVIHAISRVLVPPTGSIWHTLANDSTLYGDSSFTYLVAALNRASISTTAQNLDTLLSNGVYSIFAPSNSAFRADTNYNFSSLDGINMTNPDSLAVLLSRHIVPGRVFSSDFSQNNALATLLPGDSVKFVLTFGTTIMQKDSSGFATVNVTNLMATNGVIHRIDQVLKP